MDVNGLVNNVVYTLASSNLEWTFLTVSSAGIINTTDIVFHLGCHFVPIKLSSSIGYSSGSLIHGFIWNKSLIRKCYNILYLHMVLNHDGFKVSGWNTQ